MPHRLLALVLLLPAALQAQGLPGYTPINPVAASRTGLGFEPYRDAMPGRWLVGLGVDYASTIEYNDLATGDYFLDSELLRVSFRASRDLNRRSFLLADADVLGAYAGFLDGFLDWYHGLLGLDIPERERRPKDEFLYEVSRPPGLALDHEPSSLFIGDLRLGVGRRWTPHLQSIAAITLPTATGPDGYGRGVVSVNLFNTVRAAMNPRLTYEGSLSLGYTPRHGALERWQRTWMVAGSSGFRMGIWGRQSLFANLFYHAPYYDGTLLPALDRRELSLDFGWVLDRGHGSEWRVGMTEDLEPGGPAIDLVFRLGASF
ncbi:MAG TPA: DUF3187 family protein [Gemmatimonadales bacterium]|nr:DUF3187 family protein [Gemmatimonadales bacterium]